ncbi:MAG TPA: hypothetical protein VMT52_14625, partial [Planctomycetota bacterium]|nr:hypothetical protein [Planctomycetota bacterium]
EAQEQQRSWQGKGAGDVGKSLPYVELIRNFGEVLNSANLEFVIKSMKFNLAVRSIQGAGNRPVLRGSDSSIQLFTRDTSEADAKAHLTLMRKFGEPLSRYFDAKASSSQVQGQYKIDLTLTPKTAALKLLE